MIHALEINPTTFPPAKITNFSILLNVLVPLIQVGAALLFLFMLLRASFTWITAGDKSENLSKARRQIFFALLGLLIVFFSYLLIKIIGYFLQIEIPI